MSKLLKPNALATAFAFKPLKKNGVDEGRPVDPLGLSFKWKVTGEESGYAFAVYEMRIEPGTGIPEHIHPFAEFFYILEGNVEIVGRDGIGAPTATSLSVGESAVAPSNSPHGLRNASGASARFLSVASFEHEEAFNSIERAMAEAGSEKMSEQERAEMFIALAADMQVYFLDSTPGSS